MSRQRLVLAVAPALLRAGLRSLIGGFKGLMIVGETGSSREAVALARGLRPEIILLGGALSEFSSPETLRRIRRGSPLSRIIVLWGNGKARSSGGEPLSSDATPDQLERLLCAHPARSSPSPGSGNGREGSQLTPRQVEVLRHLSEGGGVKRAARILGISIKTVETHRAQLMKRLKIFDLAGLVRYALREDITRL